MRGRRIERVRCEAREQGAGLLRSSVVQPVPRNNDGVDREDCWARLHYGEVDYFHGIGPWYGQFRMEHQKGCGGSSLLTGRMLTRWTAVDVHGADSRSGQQLLGALRAQSLIFEI